MSFQTESVTSRYKRWEVHDFKTSTQTNSHSAKTTRLTECPKINHLGYYKRTFWVAILVSSFMVGLCPPRRLSKCLNNSFTHFEFRDVHNSCLFLALLLLYDLFLVTLWPPLIIPQGRKKNKKNHLESWWCLLSPCMSHKLSTLLSIGTCHGLHTLRTVAQVKLRLSSMSQKILHQQCYF
jgi:hypothetical protein